MKPRRTDDDGTAHHRRGCHRSGFEGPTLVLSVALVLVWFARRGSARTLHLLWTATFAVLLVLPGLSLLAPSWVLPILPARTTAIEHHLPGKTASALSATANPPSSAGRQPHPVAPFPTRYVPSPARVDGSMPLTPAVGVFLIWALGCGGWAHLPRHRRPSFPKARAGGDPDS